MMAETQHDSLLYLNAEPIRFEPVNKVTAVFFDETNKQVINVNMVLNAPYSHSHCHVYEHMIVTARHTHLHFHFNANCSKKRNKL